jgi:3-oxoacyl-[acyl-carrier protein] reductase
VKLAEMGYYVLVNYQSNETEANNTLSLIREKGSDG